LTTVATSWNMGVIKRNKKKKIEEGEKKGEEKKRKKQKKIQYSKGIMVRSR